MRETELTSMRYSGQYFKEFWSTIEINGSIYFCSHDIIFVLRGNRLSFIEPEEGKKFHKFFKINKQLFVRENNTGLKKLVGNELMFVKNSEFFADKKIDFIEEKNDKFIIGTRSSGFFSLPRITFQNNPFHQLLSYVLLRNLCVVLTHSNHHQQVLGDNQL